MQGYGLQICAAHGKKRGLQNVQEISPGQFICRPGMECQAGPGMPSQMGQQQYLGQQQQMGQMDLSNLGGLYGGVPNTMNSFGGMGGGMQGGMQGGLAQQAAMQGGLMGGMGMAQPMGGLAGGMGGGLMGGVYGQVTQGVSKQVCCIHRKERNVTSLVEVAPGAKGLRCRADDECKMGTSQAIQTEMVECSIHGKKRSTNWLECGEDGAWRCKSGSECISSVGNQKENCSEHNKFRAVEVMQQESNGLWICKPGSKCKGSNEARQPGVPYTQTSYRGGQICSLHNKKRGTKYLQPHPSIAGAMTCVPGNECM